MMEVSWAQEECGRLCELIMDANNGIAQQIIENRFDLLDLMSPKQLSEPDDLGLTIQFLTIYYDKPDAMVYLHKRGVDFSKFCDPMGFGTPMYYAVAFGRYSMIRALDAIGVSVGDTCDCMGLTPLFHADRLDDKSIRQLVNRLSDKKGRAIQMVRKNLLKRRQLKIYTAVKKAVKDAQRIIRGFIDRKRVARKKYKKKMKALNKLIGMDIEDSDSDAESVVSTANRKPSAIIEASAIATLTTDGGDHGTNHDDDVDNADGDVNLDSTSRQASARASPEPLDAGIDLEPSADRLMAEYDDEDDEEHEES